MGALREVAGEAQERGLVIYRASRLEALLGPLRHLLAATQPPHVLAPHTVIAAHPGMKQWLNGALAREYGAGGIVANLDILLPSAWIDRLAQQRLGQQAVSLPRYRRALLRWAIHEALAGDPRALGITDPRVARYLQAQGATADAARRRFQLADRLAGIYSQYLVYRPDWLSAWERHDDRAAVRGNDDAVGAATERGLLAPLWRHLRGRLGAHRGDVVGALIGHLRDEPTPASAQALHVFGVSHLAPSELAVLRAYASQRLVALYVPDPCRQYWGGLGRELSGLRGRRREEIAQIEHAAGNDYWIEQSHPLLANWGRMGQHFIMSLAGGEGDVLEDVRHWRDEQPARPAHRLARVQQGIRELDPSLMAVDLADPAVAQSERNDASLRVHACHTRLRELEVLRDQLLDVLGKPDAEGLPVRPSDIVVMAPDIQAYVPLIPSVFGKAGDGSQPLLPYHLADVAVTRSHALFGAFRRLLDLSASRITAPEVIDLLGVPDVSRRLGLDAAGVEELSEWLRRSRVAWALDGAFRQRFGVPAIAEHSFGWAMDRLLGGYVMADAATDGRQDCVRLADGSELAPLTAIHGPAAEQLGALEQLLEEIQRLCDLADKTLPASAWAVELERVFEALFRIDPMDSQAREARTMLLRFIHGVATEPASAGEDPLLHFAVVRDLLAERLDAAPERQPFLMGGVTFCGMVPQRAIPFKVVAVLGLDDGAFPRSASDSGLDLMARYRRLGDRDTRSDDRYLFLETLMSARERLHLSFIGEGVRDGKPHNPAAPLAELLASLDVAAGLEPDDARAARPWLVKHPLQPFDVRYFDGSDARLFSFDARFAAMHGSGTQEAVAPFLDLAQARPVTPELPIPLSEVRAWYKDPARQLLHGRMHLSLAALEDDRLPHDEPLDPAFPALETVARRLFFDALAAGARTVDQGTPPAWLRLGGVMPPGRPGHEAWQAECEAANRLLEQAQQLPGFERGAPPAENRDIDVPVEGQRVTGQVEHVYVTQAEGRAHWLLLRAFAGDKGALKKESGLDFKYRVGLFLDWALLRLQTARAGSELPAIRLHALLDGDTPWQDGIRRWDDAFLDMDEAARGEATSALEQRIARLLGWWAHAQGQPRWYFPKTAWEAVRHGIYPGKAKPDPARAWWDGQRGESSYGPGYNRLLAGEVAFAEGSAEADELRRFAEDLNACITMEAPTMEASA